MKAAVVSNTGQPPRWSDFPTPQANEGEALVTVSASALSPLARATAAGSHYSASAAAEFVAGVDGVGRLADGRRVYFAFPRSPFGAMARRVPVRIERTAPIPDSLDDVTAAAIANPGMSSWAALVERAKLAPGEAVLVNGATGVAGQLAVTIAKYLGAGTVVATGRDEAQFAHLQALGADQTITLTGDDDALTERLHDVISAAKVRIVLDYLWGPSALAILRAIARDTALPAAPRIRFVQIGAVSAPEISLPASLLRSSGVELIGSGLRSVAYSRLVEIVGDLLRAVAPASLQVETITRPMELVEVAWKENFGPRRLVFTLPS